MPHVDDAQAIRLWINLSVEYLAQTRGKMNLANVFPVPDSDTGTNSLLTMKSACDEVNALSPDAVPAQVLSAAARGALLGARGNSGVILSAYLQGLAAYSATDTQVMPHFGPQWWAQGLRAASSMAQAAVADPAPGTMLTSARKAAKRAKKKAKNPKADAVATVRAAAKGARKALRDSPDGLDVLREHNVLDAGAFAMTVLLTSLYTALQSPAMQPRPSDLIEKVLHIELGSANQYAATSLPRLCAADQDSADQDSDASAAHQNTHNHAADLDDLEVMLLVQQRTQLGAQDGTAVIASALEGLGSSLAVVEGGTFLHVHIHTVDSARVIRAVEDLTGVDIRLIHASVRPLHEVNTAGLGLIAVVHEPGLMADLARSGVIVLLHGVQGPGAAELRRALEDANAASGVFLCPNPRVRAVMAQLSGTDYWLPEIDDDLDTVVNTVWLQDLLTEAIVNEEPPNSACIEKGAQVLKINDALTDIADTARQVGEVAAAHPDRIVTCVFLAAPRDCDESSQLTALENALAAEQRGADLVVVPIGGPRVGTASGEESSEENREESSEDTREANPARLQQTLGVLIGDLG